MLGVQQMTKPLCWFCQKPNPTVLFEVRDNEFAPWVGLPFHLRCTKAINNGVIPRRKKDGEY